ncbi:MAG TPA: CPBP family intramembrane metalloprotease [Salinivirgaceae bacterium]|nr:CPBP family intramembrane metalloprotease [Salinivirgaceae bacterium]
MFGNKKDILRFLLLVIPLSVPFYLLNLIPVKLFPFGMPTSVLMIIVPLGLAIYGVRKNGGTDKLKEFFRAILDFKKAKKRFSLVLSFLFMPVLFLIAAIIKDPNNLLGIFQDGSIILLFVGGFVFFYFGAIFEELAWTTYATPVLQKSYGILKTGVLIGVVWGLWHLVPYIMMGHDTRTIFFLTTCSVAYRIIMGYLYRYSGGATTSALLFHTMINLTPELLPGGYKAFDFRTLAILLWVSVVIFLFCTFYRQCKKYDSKKHDNLLFV